MIGPNEWKEYFFLVNIDDFDDLLYHWRYSTVTEKKNSYKKFASENLYILAFRFKVYIHRR